MVLSDRDFRVGDWHVQPSFNRLSRGREQTHLRPRLMDVLSLLANRAGEVVSSREIIAAVWAKEFVAESVLTRSIAELREALGDVAGKPRYIETITKRGYRLVAPVEWGELTEPRGRDARTRQWVWLAAGGALALMIIAGALLWRRSGAAAFAPHLDPRFAVVAVFENRTGDAALDTIGVNAAEEVSRGLWETGAVRVVPSSEVAFVRPAYERAAAPAFHARRTLAMATGAGVVVSGRYYLEGNALLIRAEVYDAIANSVVYEIRPAAAPRERAADALEKTKQRVADAVAALYLNNAFDLVDWESKPPKWEAYKEFLAGRELIGVNNRAMMDHLGHVLELDPDFVLPLVYLTGTCFLQGDYAAASRYLDVFEGKRAQLTPIYRRMLDSRMAMLAGRWEESLVALQEAAQLAPSSAMFAYQLGAEAVYANHPREAVVALTSPLDWTPFVGRGQKWGVWYFQNLTAALHMLGEYERELAEAKRGVAIYPEEPYLIACEVRALAALGRTKEMDRKIEASLALPSRFAVPGRAMVEAALELRAHGHEEASLEAADAAVQWLRSRPSSEARSSGVLRGLAYSLLQAGRWAEGRAVFAELAARNPEDVEALGYLGRIAARTGDRAEATRISEELRRVDRPFLFGENTYQRACIAAQLGQKATATALLRDAFAEGKMFGVSLHREIDLEPLRGYTQFEELIKPKD